jgi:hypothetical protein
MQCFASCQLGGYAPQVQVAKLYQAECAILLGARSAPKQLERKGSKGAALVWGLERVFTHNTLSRCPRRTKQNFLNLKLK